MLPTPHRRAHARPASFAAFPLATMVALAASSLTAPAARAQGVDTAYTRLVKEATSDPRFLPASVAAIPEHPAIPSPRDHFGTIAGAEGVMHPSAELYGYYRALAAATPRVRVERMGTTEEGRELLLVIIADESTMGRLDHYRAQMKRLADPRTLPAAELEAVLDQAKPIYYVMGGLHSPEMGSPEMLTELAYRLAASDDPAIRRIRGSVITLINPVAEPDGRDRQVDWYHRYTKHRTEWDDGFPRSAPYWGKYVFHDNNRDGIQISQELTKAIHKAYWDWYPIVMHDLHESVPLLYISTGFGPYNANIDPITIGEWQTLANHDITQLTAQGLPGVWTWGFYDGWWPGYAIWIANNHNGIGRFYETFGNAGANTYVRDLSNSRYAGEPVTERTWYRPWPPTKKVRWSARDNINYQQAGVLASLQYVADNGRTLLRDFWQKGVNNIERGRTMEPHGYVIPRFEQQRDPARAAYLVNQLLRHGIEVHRRTAGDSAGDFVIKLDQPYRNFAVDLLSEQRFPEDAANPPYDDVAWTLGYLYGVDVDAVDDTMVFHWPGLERVTGEVRARGGVTGTGDVYLIAYRAQAEVLPALYWLRERASRARAYAAEDGFALDGGARARAGAGAGEQREVGGGAGATQAQASDTFPRGSIILENVPANVAAELADRFSLTLHAAARAPDVARHELDLPRVAIYHTWYSTQDEGWARFSFEQTGVPYTSIHKDDLRRGNLRRRFDVIVVPSVRGNVQALIHGVDRKFGPLPYTRTDEFPSHGSPSATEDMTGGPGFEGMAELQRFVEEGGTLVTLGGGTRIAAETGIARALTPVNTGNLFHPGSVVRVMARNPEHPLLYGYPDTTHVFRGNDPLFGVAHRDRDAMMVLQYGTRPLPDERADSAADGPMLGMAAQAGARAGAGEQQKAGGGGAAAAGDTTAPARAAERGTGAAPAQARGGGGGAGDTYLLSGMVRNEDRIIGHGAIFDVPVGRGRVVAFTFNPLHRWLNHHEHPMVWNALLHWNDRPARRAGGETVAAGER
ncbi:MAG TPA: M14 family zinc carboxypeptidase [Longimicrobiales bacterium]